MTDHLDYLLPRWAPRLRKREVARLYESSGRGFVDEELVDEVGIALLARAESILTATEASRGRVACVNCGSVVERASWEDQLLECTECDWRCSWGAYRKTIKYKQPNAGGMKPFLEELVNQFPKARSSSAKLILIDKLLHRYHWESASGGGRPGACGLIEGKMSNIMSFLDGLSYGDDVPGDIQATREEWRRKWKTNKWKPRIEGMSRRDKHRSE